MMLLKTTSTLSKRVIFTSYKGFSTSAKKPTGGANESVSKATNNATNASNHSSTKDGSHSTQSGSGNSAKNASVNAKESTVGSMFKAAFGGNDSQNQAQSSKGASGSSTQKSDFKADNGVTYPGYERARSELPFDNVGTRYAYLLWGMYKEAGHIDQLDSDLNNLINQIGENAHLRKVFDNDELLTESNRESALEEFFKASSGKVSPKVEAFLKTLSEMRRLKDVKAIFKSLDQVRQRLERNVHTAHVATAKKLSDAEKEKIRKTVLATFKPEGEVEIIEELKPSLGGGYEIFYDDMYHLDNTQKSLVNELEDDIDNQIKNFMGKGSAAPSGH